MYYYSQAKLEHFHGPLRVLWALGVVPIAPTGLAGLVAGCVVTLSKLTLLFMGIEPKESQRLGKLCTAETHPQVASVEPFSHL
jgi:hypothetical protein